MPDERLGANDLVGCRYRQIQRRRFPEIPPLETSVQRKARRDAGMGEVLERLPATGRKRGDFLRIDLDPRSDFAEFDTLEAIASGANLISNAVFVGEEWEVTADILVRTPDGGYMPVMVSNHRVARADVHGTMHAIGTSRLGIGQPVQVNAAQRHHTIDGYRLCLAVRGLAQVGVDKHCGAVIGQDRDWAYLVDVSRYMPATERALRLPPPKGPRRVKECATCRFWAICEPELRDSDDISLFLSGDRADTYRERGITTTQQLIDASLGDISHIAAAWRAGIPVVRRREHTTAPRFDVEIDIDVEAYLDLGAYLWGTFDGDDYLPFVIWEGLGERTEAKNFAAFWAWLMARKATAQHRGQTFAAFCYASSGENHWLLSSARRFHGRAPGVPDEQQVRAFISSDQWIDMFTVARNQVAGPGGLGLKQLAPATGFRWAEEDFAGEDSLHAYLIASTGETAEAEAARAQLLSYNGDDCRATAAVRQWLRQGATSAPVLG